ncbi:hypothetical protein LO771_19840 [Streptacidiphilus sp. ASG 303]|uniref:hypothetical protein n=1 Tax=Streptacidiphilus sp. ASG 303 TaxID=2896847 RepID=UPI001E656FE5|nr:hypothetical protein [Streptacidiphilus sp. ASG 303]MCD0484585.1 hypothetical protein [Streptacidiphilus sp. ASG 303]
MTTDLPSPGPGNPPLSGYYSIFIHPGKPVDALISDIGQAAGTILHPVEGEFIDYAGKLERGAVEVELSHEYEEDRGILFERYDSLFTIRDFDRDRERQGGTARQIFRNLAALDRYWLVLVYDLQTLINSASPSSAQTA